MSYDNRFRWNPHRLPKAIRLSVAVAAACFVNAPALSVPINPVVVNGTAAFSQAGNVLNVTNSNGAIINWQSFSIGANATTRFIQTSASSSVLNRVLSSDPSLIYGTLTSNGRVWLVNPAGIMVGPGGRVDVAGHVASTVQATNTDILVARHRLINDGTFKNIVNQSQNTTPVGGSVYVSGSEGITTVHGGAASRVSLIDSTTPGVKVDIVVAAGSSSNLGTITAEAARSGIASVIARNVGTLNASNVVGEGGASFSG